MRLIRAVTAALLLTAAALPCWGQPRGPAPLVPGEHLTARFEHERRIAGFDAPLMSTGDMVLSAEGELIWRTATPVVSELVVTRQAIAQFIDGQRTLRIPVTGRNAPGQVSELLVRILTGDWAALGIATRPQGAGWQVEGAGAALPASLARQISRIAARGNDFVDEVTLARPSGDSEQFRFLGHARRAGPLAPGDRALLERARAE